MSERHPAQKSHCAGCGVKMPRDEVVHVSQNTGGSLTEVEDVGGFIRFQLLLYERVDPL